MVEQLVQRTFFAPPRDLQPQLLYAETERGVAIPERERVTVDAGALVTTNTYFGRFPASYWQRWSSAGQVSVRVRVQGGGTVRLMASDSAGSPRAVQTRPVAVGEPVEVELRAKLDKFVDGGSLWLELDTARESLHCGDVRWYVPGRPRQRGAVVVICTFNRADDCVTTLATLRADAACMAELDAVYVVDQGTDAVESREEFAAVRETLGDKLRYIRQPNLGGAGGFTRGMVEATSGDPEQWPYVIFMDDDIVLEPDTLTRMIGFADLAASPVLVGGQMLQLLHPNRLHVAAEHADLRKIRAGRPMPNAIWNADLTKVEQETRVDGEYNAWWSCLISPTVLATIGYPLPIFFQWDDIEYGLRAKAAGFPTVTLAGAGVWHADFSWKDWDDWSRYFSIRNGLIVSALHGEFDTTVAAKVLATEIAHCLVSMRYGLAATVIAAVEDFLRGPEALRDGGAQAAATVRKLRGEYRETVVQQAHGAPAFPQTQPGPEPSRPGLVLAKRLVWNMLGRSLGAATISARDNHWWHASLFDTAVVTDPSQSGVRLRRRDKATMIDLGKRGGQVLYRFMREGKAAGHRYRAALPELTSSANWARLFGEE